MLLRGKKPANVAKEVLRFTGCLFLLPSLKENFRVILPISQLRESVDPYQYVIIKLLVKSGQYKTRKSNEMLDNQTFFSTRHFLQGPCLLKIHQDYIYDNHGTTLKKQI
jgi:hypothetical protein